MSAGLTRPTTRSSWYRYVFEHQSASGFGLFLVIVMGALGYAQVVPNGPLVVVVAMVISYEFQKRLDQGVPLLQLTCLLAVLQWLVGPLLNYSFDFEYFYGRYSMYVDEKTYFRFAVPATCAYVAVMLLAGISVRQKNIFQNVNNRSFLEFGIILNLIGLGAAFAAGRAGGSLQFLFHLLSQLRYVGALYFLFSRSQFRIPLALVSCAPLVSRSLGSGMFHDLILWSAILFCFWFAQRRWQVAVKLIVLAAVGVALFSVQVVKQDYRRQLREGKEPELVPLVVEYLKPGGKAWSDDALMLVVTRLNQGWIISAVMNHVPESESFANGQTVQDAVAAAFMPRIIFKNKKTAGGRDNFRKYTGLDIQDGTSMGISPLGEAYANFGVEIGILFMVLFGAVFAVIYRVTLRYALKYPTFLFWTPLIFYQAIKAETELLVVLNQLTKGAVIAFGGHYLLNSMLPQRRSGIPNVSARRASVPHS